MNDHVKRLVHTHTEESLRKKYEEYLIDGKNRLTIFLECRAQGFSIPECCLRMRLSKSQLHKDAKKYAVLEDTLKKGKELDEAWWDEQGRVNLENKDFNYSGYMMQRRNKHGYHNQQYKEKFEYLPKNVELKGETPLEVLKNLNRHVKEKKIALTTAERYAALLKLEIECEAALKVEEIYKRLKELEGK